MEQLLLGLVFDIYSALCMALTTLFLIFLNLASKTLSIEGFNDIVNNIYILVSVVMIFYITFNLITYIAAPEKLSDKTSGGGKLLLNIVITLALLVFVPTAFSISRDLQTAILKENVIGEIILSTKTEMSDDYFVDTSYLISRTLTRAFLTVKVDGSGSEEELAEDMFLNGESTSMTSLRQYAQDTDNYEFNWIMAIVSSVLLCLVIFGFLFDVAIRIVKLLFMEIIAPIPILFYPFQKEKFSKWIKEALSTYASMFLRLALIYFIVYLINALVSNSATNIGINEDNPVIMSFLIIGILLFAKQLPQLIADIFGIKTSGNFSLNPMARIREVPLLGSAVHTAGAAVGGAVTGAALGYRAAGGASGIVDAFKTGGVKGGMSNLGRIGSTTLRGTAFGGRAGFNQTSLMGTAVSQQKIDKTAYSAGASAVAQAITGNSDASSGIVDRVFNDMGTQLNQATFQQNKTIALAEKAYNEELAKLTNLQDSEREITSNRDVSYSRMTNYRAQLNAKGNEIATLRTNMSSEITTRVANESSAIDAQIQNLNNNKQSMLQKQLSDASASVGRALSESEVSSITQTFENNFNQTISNMQIEKTNLQTKIETQVRQEEAQLVNEYNTIQAKYSTETATYNSYNTQATDVSSKIAQQKDAVSKAKTNLDAEKDKLKTMHGPYQKNK